MKKYKLTIEDSQFDVEIDINGAVADVRMNGKDYRVKIEGSQQSDCKKTVSNVRENYSRKAEEPKTNVVNTVNNNSKGHVVNSPLPGSVMKLLVKPGSVVKRGDLLLTLEAMKMENEIVSTYDGTVSEVFVREGQTVVSDEHLLKIEN